MQVVNTLSGIGTDIRHETPPGSVHSFRTSKVRRRLEQLGEHVGVLVRELRHGFDVSFRDDQDVSRCRGIQVSEGHHVVRRVHYFGRRLACGNLAEDALTHGASLTRGATERGSGDLSLLGAFPSKIRKVLQKLARVAILARRSHDF